MSDMSGASGPSPIRVDTGPTQAPIAGRPPVPAIDTGSVETADEMVKSAMEYESRQGTRTATKTRSLRRATGVSGPHVATTRARNVRPPCSPQVGNVPLAS